MVQWSVQIECIRVVGRSALQTYVPKFGRHSVSVTVHFIYSWFCFEKMETAVVEKVVRYQKYLEKCMHDDKANEKHVSENL